LTLNNLGVLYSNARRFAEAEGPLKQAADIWRALAAQDPAVYRFVRTETLNNLASLYRDMHRDGDAQAAEAEAAK
jgi:Tetratricopeptide repeat